MIVDYHTHTALCKHGEGRPSEYVQRAISLGIDEIGCSEHIPMPEGFDGEHRMDLAEYYEVYAPQVTEVQERYRNEITVRRGLEADYFPGTEDWVGKFIQENDFDYVIGSVHFLGEWGFDNPVFVHRYDEQDVNEVYERYFAAIRQSALSGLFDVIGHCDLVKKYGHRPSKNLQELIREVLSVIKSRDLCIEINTSGLRKPVREIYPEEGILAMAGEMKIPLTLGSDAHSPGDVGRDFDRAITLIERYAGGLVSTFEKRVRREIKVSRLAVA